MSDIFNEQGVDLADIGQTLAQRPDIYFLIAWARQLHKQYNDGKLRVPAEMDFSDIDPELAEIAAAFITYVTGGDL